MGSTLAATLLNSHPDIVCHVEPFHRKWVNTEFPEINTEDVRRERDADPDAFLAALLARTPKGRILGLKILSGQAPMMSEGLAADPGFKKIVLRRDNVLASFSSNVLAQESRRYHAKTEGQRNLNKISFDARPFETYRRWCEAYYRDLRDTIASSGSLHIDVRFTDLRKPTRRAEMLEFLECDPNVPLTSDLRPISAADLSERFENWADVCRHMRDIGKEDWLTGDQDGAR